MKLDSIVLAGGCFWCLDAVYRRVEGIESVVSGYTGGALPDPSYEQVVAGTTGHAESVQITFDPSIITLNDILDIFWVIHDPTTKDRQGYDIGSQYRSAIFYNSEDQKAIVDSSLIKAAKLWPRPIVTEVTLLAAFYPAEDSHQDYFNKHPEAGYCQVIINPKLAKLRANFASRLKH
jgi:peptide-methionine (S)-S-oxide reductase